MVTAEAAVALPVLLLVLALALWVLGCVAAQLQCVDAARSAARLAARGEPAAAVVAAARAAAPAGAEVSVERAAETVVVVVQTQARPLGRVLDVLPALPVRARAVALREDAVVDPLRLP